MALVRRSGTGPASTAIYVYVSGTLSTLATIFSDGIGTPLANPFTTNLDGTWEYWFDTAVDVGTYNMYDRSSGGGGSGITQLTGDVTAGPGSGSQAATIAAGAVTNTKLADMADSTLKGRAVGAGTGDPTDLTGTQATAILDPFTGDAGAGGVQGLVPAPAAGDAAADKVLGAGGGWVTQTGGGADPNLTYLTEADETADLPNSLRLVAGTNVTFDTSTPNELEISASGGGGGITTYTSAFASPPGSPSAGDLWFPSDSFYALRYSGSAWVPWGLLQPMIDPALAAPTTWVNQGTSTLDATFGGIALTPQAVNLSNSVRMRVKTAPSTPYTITAAFTVVTFDSGSGSHATNWGLVWRQTSDGKLITVGLQTGNTGLLRVASFDWASPTDGAPATNFVYLTNYLSVGWLRITDNGTNRISQISGDGQHWVTLLTEGRTTFLTADQVGFFAYQSTTTAPEGIATLLSWQET